MSEITAELMKHIENDLKELDRKNFTTTNIEFVTDFKGTSYRVVAEKFASGWIIRDAPAQV